MAGTIITIAQQKGGAGKTSLAAHLAVAWRGEGHRVAMLDTDPQGSLSEWFKRREKSPAGTDSRFVLRALNGWRVSSEAARIRRDFDIVIIDSPPHAESEAKVAIRTGDLVVVPLQPSPMDLWAVQPTLDLASREKRPVIVVMNRVPPRGKLVETVRDDLARRSLPVTTAMLGNRQVFAASLLDGLGVTEVRGAGPAAIEIKALADELWHRLKA